VAEDRQPEVLLGNIEIRPHRNRLQELVKQIQSLVCYFLRARKARIQNAQRLRVMMWPNKSPNPFIARLIENIGATYEIIGFSFRTALLGRYRLLHVHWPEILVHSRSPLKRRLKLFLLSALIGLNRIRRVPHVWTVHNVKPHESTIPVEQLGLRLWGSSCAKRIYLTRTRLQSAKDLRGVLIVLGDYHRVRDNNRGHIRQAIQ